MVKIDKIVFCNEDYKIIHNNRDFTLINLKGNYDSHGHLKKLNTCMLVIRLMKDGIVPHSQFLQETVLRISTDEKYIEKVLNKQEKYRNKLKYHNVNNGIKNK